MPAQRIKGQEVAIIVVRDSAVEDTFTDIQNFSCEMSIEIKTQGYLGEPVDRNDEVYNGVKFDFTMHVHSQAFLRFVQAVMDRAKRRTPDVVFNITAVLNFPNGETPLVLFPDAQFSSIPISVGSRGDYVTVKMSGACNDWQLQLA